MEGDPKAMLALCLRMLEAQGIVDYNGHASIRLPGERMLINVGAAERSGLSAADICTVDFEGSVIEGRGKPPLEFHLHAGLYRARPEIGAVVHAHPRWSTYL
ncbi:MAG: class II aldolase/adducin family protein, partial [Paracoccaceae bacterium]|nr:class II aldolase/adducin family protein [Paracoccaceae bacterium]